MRKLGILIASAALIAFVYGTDASAQMDMQGKGGWGKGSTHNRMYNPKTVETISGEVVKIDKSTTKKGMRSGVHLLVKTEKETISVLLGPSRYLDKQDVKIEPKDRLEIKGSRIAFQGEPVLIASEVKKGGELLKLREEDGTPLWSGRKRR